MSKVRGVVLGGLAGVALAAAAGIHFMPGLMLTEQPSPFGVEETVAKIQQKAVDMGWVVSGVVPLNDSVKKHGGGDLPPVRLINLCQANHAFNILQEDANKVLSVMMPCTISVYEKTDGKTYVGTMNAGLLGKMFGGTVARVMGGEVAAQQKEFLSALQE
ncbi:MAG: DUF302 domain-containing protein [Kiritimatiellae bacterium]|nr:DUF302 domain-containing protein [Kiritimatiellia bacterium]